MTRKNIFRVIVGAIVLIGLIVVAQASYMNFAEKKIQSNHEKIKELVANEISYETDTLDEDMALIDEWLGKKFLSDADKGRLYERKSIIYKVRGDSDDYSRTLGYALYYLEKGHDIDYLVNLELDLAMFYIVNNSYEHARETMDRVHAIADPENITDLQVKAYLYRMMAIMAAHDGEYERAEEEFDNSNEVLKEPGAVRVADSYRAINDVNKAKVYYYKGEPDKARKLLDAHKDDPYFTPGRYASIMVRDFVLPYYETDIFLKLAEGKSVGATLNEYLKYCEEYDYMVGALQTVLYIAREYPPDTYVEIKAFLTVLNNAYVKAAAYESRTYTDLVNGEIYGSMAVISATEEKNSALMHRVRLTVLYLILTIIMVVTVLLISKSGNTDSLTNVGNRGAFNRSMKKLAGKKHRCGIIMMDIDNFKKVNDTYGHQEGDNVLIRLGGILKEISQRHIRPYRYGGEEFAVIVTDKPVEAIDIMAEKIRQTFSEQEWDFGAHITVSLGVATDKEGSLDLVKRADDNLYVSKTTGKNKVTYK